MKIKHLVLYLILLVVIIGSILICVALHNLWRDWEWISEPLHSSMEAVGSLSAAIMAVLLFQRKNEEYGGKFFLLAMGFLGMGFLYGFLAVSSHGRGFVLLHSIASLVGGFWFALIWIPWFASDRDVIRKKWLPWVIVIGSIFFGIWTLVARETLPLMVQDGKFTITAVLINFLAGMFFLAAAGRLLIDFHHSNKTEFYLLACMAILLGMTGLMFRYSSLWSSSWWFWHILRVSAFLLVLKFLFHENQRRTSDLRLALFERKQAEEALQVTHHFLETTNKFTEMTPLLKELVKEVQHFTHFAAVGIRILDKEGNIPYQTYEGFSQRFYELESPLSIKSDQCMCINVIKGVAGSKLSCYTKAGSFYTNSTTHLLSTLREEEKGSTRNVCNQFGYESVALVPIRMENQILGLIHIADSRKDMISPKMVEVLEAITMQLGTAIQRVQIEMALHRQREELAIHARILSNVLQTTDLDDRLDLILDEVLAFLGVKSGCVHLVQNNEVVLRCWRGMSDDFRANLFSFPVNNPPEWMREPFAIHEQLREQSITPPFFKKEGIQAWASLPLYLPKREGKKREWLGVILLCSRSYEVLNEDEVRALTSIGDQLAMAIDNVRIYRQAQERLTRLQTLRDIDKAIMQRFELMEVLHVVLGRLPMELGADAAAISLLDEKQLRTKVFSMRLPNGTIIEEEAFTLADSLLHWFVKRKEPVIIYNLTEDPRVQMHREFIRNGKLISYLGVPLVVHDKTIGILHILTTKPKVFADEDVGFFSTMAGQTAIAIENARSTESLRETRDYLENLLNYANAPIIVWDPMFMITQFNHAFERLTGYKANEVIGQKLSILFPEASRDELLDRIASTLKGEHWESVEIPILRKDGDVRIALWNSANIYAKDGTTLSATIAQGQDITERMHLEEQLRQSQKMEAIGRLAGGIAHDFNNLLTVIKGYSQLSLLGLKEDIPLRANIEEINKAAERAALLTYQLLAFSRRQVMEMKIIDLNNILGNLEKMLHRVIGEDIELRIVLAENLGRVKADPGQIEQVIMNLAVNARDVMPDGGKLTIETVNVELDEVYARNHIAVTPGRYVMLSMSDTGIGMTPEVKERVFEPFFTTKEMGKGTGLGLSTTYGIVKQSGGNIWVYSELGKGTTFKIYLPRVGESLEVLGEKVVKEIPRGSETILVVEDDEAVRKLTMQILERQGYMILEAHDVDETLLLCEKRKEPIHLILSDVVMPKMSGRQLVEKIKEARQDLKVLYMSGYTDNAIVHHGVLEEGMNFIQKPFTYEGLARKVREVLDK